MFYNGTKVYLNLFFILQQLFSLVVFYGINTLVFRKIDPSNSEFGSKIV